MFPLFVLAAMVAVLGSSSPASGSTGVAGVGSCGGGCGCDRCGVGAGGAPNWTEKASPPLGDPARAFAAHLLTRAMRGDAGAHQLVAVLEHAAAAGNAHALELVAHMTRELPVQRPPLTPEYVFAHMRQLGPFGQA